MLPGPIGLEEALTDREEQESRFEELEDIEGDCCYRGIFDKIGIKE